MLLYTYNIFSFAQLHHTFMLYGMFLKLNSLLGNGFTYVQSVLSIWTLPAQQSCSWYLPL